MRCGKKNSVKKKKEEEKTEKKNPFLSGSGGDHRPKVTKGMRITFEAL